MLCRFLTAVLLLSFLLDGQFANRARAWEPAAAPDDDSTIESANESPDVAKAPAGNEYAAPATAAAAPPVAAASSDYAQPAAAPAKPAAKKPIQPWKVNLFENDFSYKKDPDHEWLLGENLKDIPLDDYGPFDSLDVPILFSTGGEVRFRQMDEFNRLRPGPPARGDYQL